MKTSSPEEVGFSSTRLKRIGSAMQAYVDQNKVAGVVTMVARRGQVVHFEAFGLMDIEANKAMQLDTIFRIYSMTKPLTSVAVMMLYEQGHFQLNDPVSKFIPAFKDLKVFVKPGFFEPELAAQKREMTIRDLLIHTSGLSYGFFENSPVEAMYREADLFNPAKTVEEMVRELAKLPLIHQPGRAWHYSVATNVLTYLVEVISGRPFDTFLEQKILKPLGMNDTGFYVPQEKIERFAVNYGPTETGGLEVVDHPATSRFSKPQPFISGGGGLMSTSADYMRFAQLLLNGGQLDGLRLLSRKTVELMTMNHLPAELMPIQVGPNVLAGYGFGLGFRVLVDVAQSEVLGSVGEFGWGGLAGTYFWIDPKEELIGLLMIQLLPSDDCPIKRDFRVLSYQAIVD